MLALAVALLVGLLVLWHLGLLDASRLRDATRTAGPMAPVVFVVGYAGLTLFPVPKNVLSALAGALFGLGAGLALVWVAAMVGALVSFFIARAVDGRALDRLTGRHRARVEALLAHHGVASIVAIRLVPVAPFTVVNYVAGLCGVRWRAYAVGTGIGILPGTLAYVAVGAYGLQSPSRVALAGAALLLLMLAGTLWSRRLAGRRTDAD